MKLFMTHIKMCQIIFLFVSAVSVISGLAKTNQVKSGQSLNQMGDHRRRVSRQATEEGQSSGTFMDEMPGGGGGQIEVGEMMTTIRNSIRPLATGQRRQPQPINDARAGAMTLEKIQNGADGIQLYDDLKNLVLLVGDHNSDKKIVGQFMTGDNDDLVAYWDDHQFRIREANRRIGTGARRLVESPEIPAFMLESTTNTAFYDLPSFPSTGQLDDPVQEISRSFYTKRVVDHARSVKIILVASHATFSDTDDGPPTNFLRLLDHLHNFMPKSTKFHDAIALIVTHVDEPGQNSEEIVEDIATFLTTTRDALPQSIRGDPTKLRNCRHFIDAMMVKESGFYVKIGILRSPDMAGPLSQIPVVQSTNDLLGRVIWDETFFVQVEEGDFSFVVSASAQTLAQRLADDMSGRMVNLTEVLGREIQSGVQNARLPPSTDDSCSPLEELKNKYRQIKNLTDIPGQMTRSPMTKNVDEKSLQDLTIEAIKRMGKIVGTRNVEIILGNLDAERERLNFFEQITTIPTAASSRSRGSDWMTPIFAAVDGIRDKIFSASRQLNENFNLRLTAVGAILENKCWTNFNVTERQTGDDLKTIQVTLTRSLAIVVEIKNLRHKVKTPAEFLSKFIPMMRQLPPTVQISEGELRPLEKFCPADPAAGVSPESLEMDRVSPYTPHNWTIPFERLMPILNRQLTQVAVNLSDWESAQRLREQSAQILILEDRLRNVTSSATEGLTEQQRRLEAEQKEERAQLQEAIRKLEQKIVKLAAPSTTTIPTTTTTTTPKPTITTMITTTAHPISRNPFSWSWRSIFFPPAGPLKVGLFEHMLLGGRSLQLRYSSVTCVDLWGWFAKTVSSVNTHGTCVRLYADLKCRGSFVVIKPGTMCAWHLFSCGFNDRSLSVGPCFN